MTGRGAGVFDIVRAGDRRALSALLSGYPALSSSIDDDGTPLLHAAAARDDPVMVEMVLDAGGDLDARAPWGQTAMEWAANMGCSAAAEVFVARGCRLDLWTAAALGKLEVVRTFFANGSLVDGAGRTPAPGADLSGWPDDTPYRRGDAVSDAFYIACRNGALAVARELLERGADVDATGYFGATALHWAAFLGREAVVDWLVEAGADVGRPDPEFDATPAGWAREGGHDALARRLETLE